MMPYRTVAVLALVAAGGVSWAIPQAGGALARVEVEDVAAGRMRPLPDGHPVLVFYEDKEAAGQNQEAQRVLGRINDRAENRARFEFVAVADVEKWSWWPAKRSVVADLRRIAQRENTRLYADWRGAVRAAWHFSAHKSTLVLAGSDGKVLFSGEGTLSAAQLGALVAQLQALGCKVD